MTTYEALSRLAHRASNSESERLELERAFLDAFGSDDEKTRFYKESEGDAQIRIAKEKFETAVAAEVKVREAAAAQDTAVKAAADKAVAAPVVVPADVPAAVPA